MAQAAEAKMAAEAAAEVARLEAETVAAAKVEAEAAAAEEKAAAVTAAAAAAAAAAVTAAAAAAAVEVEQQQQQQQQQQQVAAAKADADAEAAAVIAAQEQAAEQAAAATAAQEALAMAQAAEAKMAADAAAENMDDAHAEEEELVVADADTKTAKKTDSNQSRIPRLRSLHELKTRQWHRRVAAAAMQHETGGALAAPIAATTGVGSRTQTDTLSGDEKLSAAGETMQAPGRWVLNVSAARGGTKCMLSLLAEEQGWCCSTAAGRGSIFWTVTTDETDAVLAVKHPNQRVSRIPGCFEL